jgi:hypothetical protein
MFQSRCNRMDDIVNLGKLRKANQGRVTASHLEISLNLILARLIQVWEWKLFHHRHGCGFNNITRRIRKHNSLSKQLCWVKISLIWVCWHLRYVLRRTGIKPEQKASVVQRQSNCWILKNSFCVYTCLIIVFLQVIWSRTINSHSGMVNELGFTIW